MTTTDTTAMTMQAIVQDRYGSADVLRLAEIARPEMADDQVLLRCTRPGSTGACGTR